MSRLNPYAAYVFSFKNLDPGSPGRLRIYREKGIVERNSLIQHSRTHYLEYPRKRLFRDVGGEPPSPYMYRKTLDLTD